MRREREERIGLGWGWRISHSLQTQTDRHRRTRTGNQVGRQLGEGERWETGSRLGWAREKRRRTTALCGCGVWKLRGKKKGEGHGLTDWLGLSVCLSVCLHLFPACFCFNLPICLYLWCLDRLSSQRLDSLQSSTRKMHSYYILIPHPIDYPYMPICIFPRLLLCLFWACVSAYYLPAWKKPVA